MRVEAAANDDDGIAIDRYWPTNAKLLDDSQHRVIGNGSFVSIDYKIGDETHSLNTDAIQQICEEKLRVFFQAKAISP